MATSDGFCCLGVACEVAIEAGVDVPRDLGDGMIYYDNCSQYLPPVVEKWLGVDNMSPLVTIDDEGGSELHEWETDSYATGQTIALAELNDAGVPFRIIANLIERCM